MISSPRDAGTAPAPVTKFPRVPAQTSATLGSLLCISICFGVIAGFGEGFGLLLFQRINWRQWARVMHVSKEILWISPVVDLCFFLVIGVAVTMAARIFRRMPAARVLAFVLILLMSYDWLMLTGHFYRRAALLFALGVAVTFSRWFSKHEWAAVAFYRRTTIWLVVALGLVFVGI